MEKESAELGKVPRLTPEGVDFAKVHIDPIIKQAMSGSEREFSDALGILQVMHRAGRSEAGIFLLGLLSHSGDDWKRRTEIVERLEGFTTPECAHYLFGELERVKSNNTTRQYLVTVLKALAAMPRQVVQSRFLHLIANKGFSQGMRDRFVETLDKTSLR